MGTELVRQARDNTRTTSIPGIMMMSRMTTKVEPDDRLTRPNQIWELHAEHRRGEPGLGIGSFCPTKSAMACSSSHTACIFDSRVPLLALRGLGGNPRPLGRRLYVV